MDISNYIDLLRQLFEPAYIIDAQRTILFWNESAEKLTGYEASKMIGKKCNNNLMMHINEEGDKLCMTQCPLTKILYDGEKSEKPFYLQHKKGHRILVQTRFIAIRNEEGIVIGAIEFFVKKGQGDSMSQPSLIKELVKAAYVDSVTNLPNKEYMENKIKNLLVDAVERPSEVSLGLLAIEIQNLRDFNSQGGSAAGNLLLKVITRTLLGSVEIEEGCLICKWYGGSFVIFMNTNKIPTLLNWANKLKNSLEKTHVAGYEEENTMVVIGGICAQPGENVGDVLKRLESQLQLSKSQSSGISIN